MAAAPPRIGRVTAYDEDAGHGLVRGDDGAELYFHCTALADGSREVAVGARVAFLVAPGAPGRWEAVSLVKI
jgi:cold shock CspA family protein